MPSSESPEMSRKKIKTEAPLGGSEKEQIVNSKMLVSHLLPSCLSEEGDPNITRVEELIYEVKIQEVMTCDPITAAPDDLLSDVRRKMKDRHISGVPVIERKRLVGMISMEDLLLALEQGKINTRAKESMSSPVLTCYADEPLARAISRFDIRGFGRFPVIDHQGKLLGIITRGNIVHGLLRALEKGYHEEETLKEDATYLLQHVESERTCLSLSYHIKAKDYRHSGSVAKQIKQALLRLGANPQSLRRAAIATFEAETNVMIHGEGGLLIALIKPYSIVIRTIDRGPGIQDIEKALRPGFSTAPEWAKDLGFGSGMGLNNIQRCTDEMQIRSVPGKGTFMEFKIIPKTSIALREKLQRRGKNEIRKDSK
jgi:CBS domain-containing protein/anti-sigma regulatory factor (Ser/Thr protein kinase)